MGQKFGDMNMHCKIKHCKHTNNIGRRGDWAHNIWLHDVNREMWPLVMQNLYTREDTYIIATLSTSIIKHDYIFDLLPACKNCYETTRLSTQQPSLTQQEKKKNMTLGYECLPFSRDGKPPQVGNLKTLFLSEYGKANIGLCFEFGCNSRVESWNLFSCCWDTDPQRQYLSYVYKQWCTMKLHVTKKTKLYQHYWCSLFRFPEILINSNVNKPWLSRNTSQCTWSRNYGEEVTSNP